MPTRTHHPSFDAMLAAIRQHGPGLTWIGADEPTRLLVGYFCPSLDVTHTMHFKQIEHAPQVYKQCLRSAAGKQAFLQFLSDGQPPMQAAAP